MEKELTKLEPKHNERGDGRKSSLTEEQLQKVQQLRSEGLSYNAIAKEVGLSKAYVYKLINKQEHTENKRYTKEDIARINRLRQGLRDMSHTHSLTKDLDIEIARTQVDTGYHAIIQFFFKVKGIIVCATIK